MANISDVLADLAISRSLLIQRISNGLSADVASIYQSIINDIDGAIRSADPITIKNMRGVIAELKERVQPDITFMYDDLKDLAVTEGAFAYNTMNAAVGIDIFKKLPPDSTLKNIFNTSLMTDGKRAAKITEWFDAVDASMFKDLDGAIKQGVVQGETNALIADRVNAIMNTTKNGAEAFTRTAVSHISNRARETVYEANESVIRGYEFHATLDGRTSKGCAVRDGAFYDTQRKPLNDKGEAFPYESVPRHVNCRSVYLPILKSWEELGLPFDEIPKGTRSSLDGAVSSDTTFEKWFEGKDKVFQEQYLGVGRYKLYKDGKITFRDLVNQRGETLTIKSLKEKYN